jgi:hypothetical protein
MPQALTLIDRIFLRVDRDGDHAIAPHELTGNLTELGITPGPGGIVHRQAAKGFSQLFDTDENDRVTPAEVRANIGALLPKALRNSAGQLDQERCEAFFREANTDSDRAVLTQEETDRAIQARLPGLLPFKGFIAQTAAAMLHQALDQDGQPGLTQEELESATTVLCALDRARSRDPKVQA